MFDPNQHPFGRYPFGQHFEHPGWLFASHLIGMLLFAGAVVGALLLLRSWLRNGRAHHSPWSHHALAQDPAVATVRARFAAGQIGAEEYAALMIGLGGATPMAAATVPSPAPPAK